MNKNIFFFIFFLIVNCLTFGISGVSLFWAWLELPFLRWIIEAEEFSIMLITQFCSSLFKNCFSQGLTELITTQESFESSLAETSANENVVNTKTNIKSILLI